jgi:hypothetical protein
VAQIRAVAVGGLDESQPGDLAEVFGIVARAVEASGYGIRHAQVLDREIACGLGSR